MKVSCEKEKLNVCVQTALRAVSTRVTMPILSGILINAEEGRITVSATDLEMSIRSEAEGDVQESGSTVVSGRLLGDIVKNISGGEVSVETSEKFLTLKSGGGEYRIREMMPEDFPQIPSWEGEAVMKIPGRNFTMAAQQTSRASSSDEKRPVLTGTLIERKAGEGAIRFVSTDSYRLAWSEIEAGSDVSGWGDSIIPTKTLIEVARLASGVESDVEMKMQEKQAMFKTDDLLVTSRLIEGQFPNYKQLVPKGERTEAKFKKEEFLALLKRALIFGHNVKLGVHGDHIRISTETPEVGESKEDIAAEVKGEDLEIGFNGGYLMDGIAGVEGETVEIKMDDPQKPAMIKSDESDSYIYIIMPVRLR
jgi:DNA polymerase-3 subunit beta